MTYRLGVDLGTTYTAAALAEAGAVRMVTLGPRWTAVPSVVFVDPQGARLFGDAAEQAGLRDPEGLLRGVKRRIGDPVQLHPRGLALDPESVMAELLAWVLGIVTEQQGGPPEALALTHPANWVAYQLERLDEIAKTAGWRTYGRLTEPEAAALEYASHARVEDGSVVAVYDLGGGTFDASVLRKTGDRFALLGDPEGIERLGGLDFDDAVVAFVRDALADDLAGMDPFDPALQPDLARLRDECVRAKETLSGSPEAVVSAHIGEVRRDLRITRAEFEALIEPMVTDSVDALERALQKANVAPADLRSVLLVGGSSRIPLVGRMVAERLERPVAVDAHPKDVVALGAARFAELMEAGVIVREIPTVAPTPPTTSTTPTTQPAPSGGFRPRDFVLFGVVAAIVAIVVVGMVLFLRDEDPVVELQPIAAAALSEDRNDLRAFFATSDQAWSGLVRNPVSGENLQANCATVVRSLQLGSDGSLPEGVEEELDGLDQPLVDVVEALRSWWVTCARTTDSTELTGAADGVDAAYAALPDDLVAPSTGSP